RRGVGAAGAHPRRNGHAASRAAAGDRTGLLRRPDPARDRGAAQRAAGHDQDPHASGDAEAQGSAGPAGGAVGLRTVQGMSEHEDHHDAIAELIPAYVLGALEPDELEAVELHLLECPRCRAEVDEQRQVTALLPYLAEPRSVPVRARRELLARIDRKSTRLNSSHVKISYAVLC